MYGNEVPAKKKKKKRSKAKGPSVEAEDSPILKLTYLFFDKKDNEYSSILSMNWCVLSEVCKK
jgi:hypothetical protein